MNVETLLRILDTILGEKAAHAAPSADPWIRGYELGRVNAYRNVRGWILGGVFGEIEDAQRLPGIVAASAPWRLA